jgi:HK97 family phage major capsid protein
MDVKKVRDSIAEKSAELKGLFEEIKDQESGATPEQKQAVIDRNEELASLRDDLKVAEAKSKLDISDSPVASMPNPSEESKGSSFGAEVMKSAAYKAYTENGAKNIQSTIPFELKTNLTTTGYPPESLRQPGILETALRDPNAVINLFDQITTDQNAFVYLEETTFTNNAAEAAEAAAVGEAALAFTERTATISKLGVNIPVTDELMQDVSGLESYLNSRLQTMMRLRLDSQLLSGDGTSPNIEGLLDAGKSSVGSTDFSAYTGGLGRIGAIYGAITDIRVNAFTEPDAIVIHPNDWSQIVLQLDSDFAGTDSAGYTAKAPVFTTAGGYAGGVANQLWGLKVVPSTAISEGTILVGKFGGGEAAHVVMRQGMDIAVSDSHGENFTKNIMVIRATMRVGFPVYRQTAFHKITSA